MSCSDVITDILQKRGYEPNSVEVRKLREMDIRMRKGDVGYEEVEAFVRKKDKNFWKYFDSAAYRELMKEI